MCWTARWVIPQTKCWNFEKVERLEIEKAEIAARERELVETAARAESVARVQAGIAAGEAAWVHVRCGNGSSESSWDRFDGEGEDPQPPRYNNNDFTTWRVKMQLFLAL